MSEQVQEAVGKHEKWVKYLSFVGKAVGMVGSLNQIPGLSPEKSVVVFFAASLLKDTVNRIIDFLDDGKVNNSVGQIK